MDLQLASGPIICGANEEDILSHVEREDFAILSIEPDSYIQCSEQNEPSSGYVREYQDGSLVTRRARVHPRGKGHYALEYQDGSLDAHFQAVDGPITLDRILSAFLKYLRGDQSWRSDFRWEKMEL